MALKKSDLYASIWASCDELRGGMDARQYKDNNLLAGSSINNLRPNSIESLAFSAPSLTEQTATAAVISDMDAELEALEGRRDKAKALKRAMMQELLTGRTRLV